ncbi:hypothetical protein ACLQ3K_19835 [Tsukamurella sp. DT100]|uniref:hypothetical protein n=1 Tax=Tsukamurella sp. DT100 TaxID=3393415 RepID=UPI003CECE123
MTAVEKAMWKGHDPPAHEMRHIGADHGEQTGADQCRLGVLHAQHDAGESDVGVGDEDDASLAPGSLRPQRAGERSPGDDGGCRDHAEADEPDRDLSPPAVARTVGDDDGDRAERAEPERQGRDGVPPQLIPELDAAEEVARCPASQGHLLHAAHRRTTTPAAIAIATALRSARAGVDDCVDGVTGSTKSNWSKQKSCPLVTAERGDLARGVTVTPAPTAGVANEHSSVWYVFERDRMIERERGGEFE